MEQGMAIVYEKNGLLKEMKKRTKRICIKGDYAEKSHANIDRGRNKGGKENVN